MHKYKTAMQQLRTCINEYEYESITISPDAMAADNKADKYELDAQLINAVREFPHLYDPTARNYRDPELVADAWREIAKLIGVKDQPWTEYKERWRKLRDAYVKVKKSLECQPDGDRKPITWIHYEEMSFLADHIKHRGSGDKRGGKRSLDHDVEDELQDMTMSAEEAFGEVQVGPSRRRDSKRGRKVDPMQVTIVEALAQGANSKIPTEVIIDDEEGLFGRMVAATLRRFPPRAKARCKFRIQEIIFQQENDNLGGAL